MHVADAGKSTDGKLVFSSNAVDESLEIRHVVSGLDAGQRLEKLA
jgi:hypothetical protein